MSAGARGTSDTTETSKSSDAAQASPDLVPCTLGEFTKYFLHLGTFGFGGPIALAGYMQKDLVDKRKWISKDDYVQGLALAQLAPGPLAAQLAIYLGWVRGGVLGATLIGLAFVMPSFLMVLALAAVYVQFGGISWMRGAFYGIGAAVIAIIARSAYKLVKMTVAKDKVLWVLFAGSAFLTAYTESENVLLFLGSGLLYMLIRARPKAFGTGIVPGAVPPWLIVGLLGPATLGTLGTLAWYFAEAGAFVFGSGLAIVPFLHGGVVTRFHWLTEQQFLDAVAVAMITPGPVVITVGFIGYLVGGPTGASVAALATFVPCYLFTILPAPHFRRFAKNASIQAFVDGVTAAATGAITGAAFVLGKRAIFDLPTALIACVTVALLVKFKKIQEPLLIAASGVVGILLKALV